MQLQITENKNSLSKQGFVFHTEQYVQRWEVRCYHGLELFLILYSMICKFLYSSPHDCEVTFYLWVWHLYSMQRKGER